MYHQVVTIQERPISPDELLALPLVDLIEMSTDRYVALLRADELPSPEVLEALDDVLRHRVVQVLRQKHNQAGWDLQVDDLRRLVPHTRRSELDAGEQPWAARWDMLADLVATAAALEETRERRRSVDAEAATSTPAHGDVVLRALTASEGCSQATLGESLGLKPQNLSRILGLLETDGLVRREVVGREKRVYLVRAQAAQGDDAARNRRTGRSDWRTIASHGAKEAALVAAGN